VPARLQLIDSYLSEFNKTSPNSDIGIEPLRDLSGEPRISEKFPTISDDPSSSAENMYQVNWLLNEEPFSAKEHLTLSILDHLLMVGYLC
jgi:hypothetical protein